MAERERRAAIAPRRGGETSRRTRRRSQTLRGGEGGGSDSRDRRRAGLFGARKRRGRRRTDPPRRPRHCRGRPARRRFRGAQAPGRRPRPHSLGAQRENHRRADRRYPPSSARCAPSWRPSRRDRRATPAERAMDPDSALYSWLFLPSFWVAVAIVRSARTWCWVSSSSSCRSASRRSSSPACCSPTTPAGSATPWRSTTGATSGCGSPACRWRRCFVIRWVFQRWFSSAHDINRY